MRKALYWFCWSVIATFFVVYIVAHIAVHGVMPLILGIFITACVMGVIFL